mmetsp:Transcript_5397/g.4581  ORF Transcript_5397/g.4581 Transcript_5397/m.4581 type:complete len:88 (+) Transcript_5397:625-888(+)
MLGALRDPSMRSMLSDPNVINAAINMMNRMDNNPFSGGTMQGQSGSFPAPGGNESNNSNSTSNNTSTSNNNTSNSTNNNNTSNNQQQ